MSDADTAGQFLVGLAPVGVPLLWRVYHCYSCRGRHFEGEPVFEEHRYRKPPPRMMFVDSCFVGDSREQRHHVSGGSGPAPPMTGSTEVT